MCRIAAYLSILSLLPVVACEPGGQAAAEAAAHPAGLGSAAALVDAPPETIPTVIRRVWSGPGAHYEVSPSPDGRFVSEGDGVDIVVRDLETGETRRVTRNPAPDQSYAYYPRVSRDGKRIAYTFYNGERGLFELRVVDWNGSEPRSLQDIDWEIEAHAWSRDGRFILASRMGAEVDPPELILVATADGSMTVLESLRSWPDAADFSPDGRFVAYDGPSREHAGQRDIFVLELEGRSTRIVNDASDDYLLGWARDGQHILYCSDRTGTPGVWLLPVRNGRPAGAPELVLPDAWGIAPVGFLSDGRYLYGVQTGGYDIYVANLSADYMSVATPPRLATSRRLGSGRGPEWSPDGRHLAYTRGRHGPGGAPSGLVIRSLETGEVRELRLSDGLRPWAAPRWAPDGRSLVLLAGDAIAPTGVYRVDLQTGRSEALISERLVSPGQGIDLSPDGRFLYYRTWVEGEDPSFVRVFRKDLESGVTEEIYKVPVGWVWSIAVSPDGSNLAVALRTDSEPRLVILPAAGGEARGLSTLSEHRIGSIAWTPDGQAILYPWPNFERRRWDVWRLALAGGDAEPIGLEMEAAIGQLRLHPDGRRLAFVAGSSAAELWVMEDFLPGYGTGNGGDRRD
jgi:Tol biopolymer transport system component